MRSGQKNSRGFTLFETVVVIGIVGVLSAILLVAYPTARDQQTLQLAQQQLQAVFRSAAKAAVNEERAPACLLLPEAVDKLHVCSDIGVSLGATSITIFADINGDSKYISGEDYLIRQEFLTGNAVASAGSDFVFRSTPPVLQLFTAKKEIANDSDAAPLLLRAGSETRNLKVFHYGYITSE